MKIIKDDKDRLIHIFDNAISQAEHENFYTFVTKSYYQIGFGDTDSIEESANRYIHSMYTLEDLKASGFYEALQKSEAWQLIKDREIKNITINLSVPSDTNFCHTHKNYISLIYYANYRWSPEWAGETLFYSDDMKDIIYASAYTPRRLIIFDGEIPHSLKVQSNKAPHYRFTLAMFFNKGVSK